MISTIPGAKDPSALPIVKQNKLTTTAIGRWKHDWVWDISGVPSRFVERHIRPVADIRHLTERGRGKIF